MAVNFEREKELFNEALDLPLSEARRAFLKDACGPDHALREKIEALLKAFESADGFIPTHSNGVQGSDVPGVVLEQPGDRIGRYKLLEKIGEGGCGVVYLAEQEEPVRRRVALKIIKLGLETRGVIARFEAERQALAMMDHPNIAKILDGGVTGDDAHERRAGVPPAPAASAAEEHATAPDSQPSTSNPQLPTGRPYFVMELVRGIRITEYCEQHQLSTRERLDLFIQVCSAIQHAHQKGVIHRDIKPSNLLVTENDGRPVPKVIDFGIAKATEQKLTDKTLFTQFAAFIGTPAYMSPEQAALTSVDIDTRSDIYSLGVLLYELLTGTTPFDAQELLKAGFDEMRRVIRETEPEKPSTRLTQRLGRGTGAHGLRRPDAAFPSPRESPAAPDMPTCSQSGVMPPQSTEPPHTLSGAKNLIHQLRGDLDWIVMKCLEKDRARRYETANGLAADLQRHLGNEPVVARPPSAAYRFQKLVRRNKVVFAAGAAVAAALLIGLGVSTWLFVKERAARSRAEAQQRRAESAEVKAAQETATAKAVNDFLRQDLLATADSNVQVGMGIPANPNLTVLEALDRASARIGDRFRDQPLVEAAIRFTIGQTYSGLGDHFMATPHLERSLELRRTHLGSKHEDTVSGMRWLAHSYRRLKRAAEALRLLEEIVWTNAGLRSATSDNLDYQRKLNDLSNLGLTLLDAGRATEAVSVMEEVLKGSQASQGRFSTPVAMYYLAHAYAGSGQSDKAIRLGQEALKLQLTQRGPEDRTTQLIMDFVATRLFNNHGRQAEALPLLEEVLKQRRTQLGSEHPDTLASMNALGIAYRVLGRTNEAEAILRESADLTRKVEDKRPGRSARGLSLVGDHFFNIRQYADADRFYAEAVALARKGATNDPGSLRSCLGDYAPFLKHQKRWAEAEPLYREVLQLYRAALPPTHDDVIYRAVALGRFLAEWALEETTNAAPLRSGTTGGPAGHAREAERLLRDCLATRVQTLKPDSSRLADTRSCLGGALVAVAVADTALDSEAHLAKLTEADALLLSANDDLQQSKTADSQSKRASFERLIRLYEEWKKPDQAAEWRRKLEAFNKVRAEQKAAASKEAPQ